MSATRSIQLSKETLDELGLILSEEFAVVLPHDELAKAGEQIVSFVETLALMEARVAEKREKTI